MEEFIKKNVLLALDRPKRNLLGDLCIGWNRPARGTSESVSMEKAHEWLKQDIEKARKQANKVAALGSNDVAVFILFYIGVRRYDEFYKFLRDLSEADAKRDKVRLAIEITNHRYFQSNPSLAVYLAKKVLTGEKTL